MNTPLERVKTAIREVAARVPGREDMVFALGLAVLAGEHVLLVGPPGVAKTYAVRLFAQSLNAKWYMYLLTKFTTPDELLGPIDVSALARGGELKRRWTNAVEADFIFIDEIYKASSATLNALLSLLQERAVYDPMTGQVVYAKLWTLIGASNEVPAEEELQALHDRFGVKLFITSYLPQEKILDALNARWAQGGAIAPVATMEDVRAAHEEVMRMAPHLLKGYYINVVPLMKSLNLSDRTVVEKGVKIYAAYIALNPEARAAAPYEILRFFARDREELAEVEKKVKEALGEVAEVVDLLEKARVYYRAMDLKTAKDLLLQAIDKAKQINLDRKPWLKPKLESVIGDISHYLAKIDEIQRHLTAHE